MQMSSGSLELLELNILSSVEQYESQSQLLISDNDDKDEVDDEEERPVKDDEQQFSCTRIFSGSCGAGGSNEEDKDRISLGIDNDDVTLDVT